MIGKDLFLHFVYAEHGYIVDAERIFVRTLSTVFEGEARMFGKSIVLNCRKELQKCMRVEWNQDGKPPSANVISEKICVISPPSRVVVTSSHNGSLLTLRKAKNAFVVKLWKSTSKNGDTESKKLDRLQALFGSKLQWVSEKANSIPEQISLPDAIEHYTNLDSLMKEYDPSLGNSEEKLEGREVGDDDDDEEKKTLASNSIDMFVARDLTKQNDDGKLLIVRDATTGEMIDVESLERPITFSSDVNTRRDSWSKISDRCVSASREQENQNEDLESDDSPVYSAVLNLLGGSILRGLRGRVRVKWGTRSEFMNEDLDMMILTPPPKMKRITSLNRRSSSSHGNEKKILVRKSQRGRGGNQNDDNDDDDCENEVEEEEEWGGFSALGISKDGFHVMLKDNLQCS